MSPKTPKSPRPMKLASASWKGGLLIRQQIPGVESVAILRRGFGGDAKINTTTIPVSGLYADEYFFNVFSYPLVRGVAATALKQPNSLVLTETTAKKLFGQVDAMGQTLTILQDIDIQHNPAVGSTSRSTPTISPPRWSPSRAYGNTLTRFTPSTPNYMTNRSNERIAYIR